MEAVAVAVVGALGLVGQAWVTTQRTKRIEEAVQRANDSLGAKNGQGNAIQILEHLKREASDMRAWQQRHEGRHDVLEETVARLTDRRN